MTVDTDVAILGAGCAGLSLAIALQQRRSPLRVLLLEQRTTYNRDRTWCFWNTEPHPFEDCITYRWNRWRVAAGNEAVVSTSTRFAYQHLPAERFYQAALDRIEASSTQELRRGTLVHTVAGQPGKYRLETSDGSITARHVFDSRPSAHASAPGTLVQRFLGWHIRTQLPTFDPATVDLMNFQAGSVTGRNHFLYVLPYSTTEALVESTYLDVAELSQPDMESDLCGWIAQHTEASPYEILFREQGTLPMHPAAPECTAGTRIGIRGGRLKPSSGYAFLRIQRHSRLLAHALCTDEPAPRFFESRFYAWLDRIFLEALRLAPEAAPSYFLSLFRHVPADRLVRFLSETGNLAETLQVASTLPTLPFLRAAFSTAAGLS